MLPETARIVSVDDHIVEHASVWTDRVPRKFQDRCPRIVEDEHGRESWLFDGMSFEQVALGAVVGSAIEDFSREPRNFSEIRPGCYDPKARLEDMDVDGVHASLGFPSFSRFAGQRFLETDDRELGLACVQAYNDFILDEFCAVNPARLIPMIILPLWDVEQATQELRRTHEKGARAIAFPENPANLELPSFHSDAWDPLFGTAAEMGTPLCMHIGSSSSMITSSSDAPQVVRVGLNGVNSMVACVDLLYSQVFVKFPLLKVALSEGGAGWVPYILEKATWTWERHRFTGERLPDVPPDELFREHIYVCFIDDEVAVDQRHRIGIENLMWECDYPHADCHWPNSRKHVEETLSAVPDDEAVAIAGGNATRLLGLDN